MIALPSADRAPRPRLGPTPRGLASRMKPQSVCDIGEIAAEIVRELDSAAAQGNSSAIDDKKSGESK